MASVGVSYPVDMDKDGFNDHKVPGENWYSGMVQSAEEICEKSGQWPNSGGYRDWDVAEPRCVADQRQLLLRYRHVYAGKGGWYGYRTGRYASVTSQSNNQPDVTAATRHNANKKKKPFVAHKYRKEILKKLSKTVQSSETGGSIERDNSSGEEPRTSRQKLGSVANSTAQNLNNPGNDGQFAHREGELSATFHIASGSDQQAHVDTIKSPIPALCTDQCLPRSSLQHISTQDGVITTTAGVGENRVITRRTEKDTATHLTDMVTVIALNEREAMMKTREENYRGSNFGPSFNKMESNTKMAHVQQHDVVKNKKDKRRKSIPTTSTRRNMNLFSRLSVEAQAAIHETRKEMGLELNDNDDDNDEDEEEDEDEYKNEERDVTKTGRTVDIEFVALETNPKYETQENNGCHGHNNGIHNNNCSCKTRAGIVLKGTKETSIRIPYSSIAPKKGGSKVTVAEREGFHNGNNTSRSNTRKASSKGLTPRTNNSTKLPHIKSDPLIKPDTPPLEDDPPDHNHLIPGIGNYKMFLPKGSKMKREPSFHITPVGYDSRYVDPPRLNDIEETPEEVKAKAVEKCNDWLDKYL